jgi:hypothetical protein
MDPNSIPNEIEPAAGEPQDPEHDLASYAAVVIDAGLTRAEDKAVEPCTRGKEHARDGHEEIPWAVSLR